MLKQPIKDMLNAKLKEVLEKYGVPSDGIQVMDEVDYVAFVPVEKDFANQYSEQLTKVFREFGKTDGIKRGSGNDTGADGYVFKGIEKRKFWFEVKKGLWERTATDIKYDEDYYDDEIQQKRLAAEKEEMRKFYKDYLFPIPSPAPTATDQIYLTMAYKFYDAIRDGYRDEETGEWKRKTVEYRAYSETYVKRLLSHPIHTVKFQRGYGGPGRPKPEQMVYAVKRIFLAEEDIEVTTDPFNVAEGFLPRWIGIELGERIS